MNTSAKLPELIGVAGTFASGKDLLAHYLSAHYGYTHPSTSELVRNIAMREHGSIERDVLYTVADAYRKKHGGGVFVTMSLNEPRPTIITGLRSRGEGEAIKAAGGTLVFVDAPPELRYERMVARDRDLESTLTHDEFMAREAKEWNAGETDTDFNLRDLKAMADIILDSSEGKAAYIQHALEMLALKPLP